MIGAIFSHLFTDLGIVVKWTQVDSDGGLLLEWQLFAYFFFDYYFIFTLQKKLSNKLNKKSNWFIICLV